MTQRSDPGVDYTVARIPERRRRVRAEACATRRDFHSLRTTRVFAVIVEHVGAPCPAVDEEGEPRCQLVLCKGATTDMINLPCRLDK